MIGRVSLLVLATVGAGGLAGWWTLGARPAPGLPETSSQTRGLHRWNPLRASIDRRVATALPDTLEVLARSLRSGQSMRSAIGDAARSAEGPLAADLRTMVVRLERGASVPGVLARWTRERAGVRGVQLSAAAMTLAGEAGGSIAQAIDGVADTLRAELAVHAEVRSLASQAQASALLIAVLPLVFGVVAGLADPTTLGFLTSTAVGRFCLVAGLGLDLGGFVWMHRITTRISA